MKIAVSACLLGYNCKYNGQNNLNERVVFLKSKHMLCPICPEIYGELSTPRYPAEIIGSKVISKIGVDVTDNYLSGANLAYKVINEKEIKVAILKANSPSCGVGKVYDGSFTSKLTTGDGITTKLLKEKGIIVYSENDNWELIK